MKLQFSISIIFHQDDMGESQTYLFHIFPIIPGSGFISAKLCRLALAAASVLLRFWFMRPLKSPPLWEPCMQKSCQQILHVKVFST